MGNPDEEKRFLEDFEGMAAEQQMSATESYIRRGRGYAAVPIETLRAEWTGAFKAYVDALVNGSKGLLKLAQLRKDLEAELLIRNSPVPYSEVQEAARILVLFAAWANDRLTAERREEVDDELAEDVEDFRQRRDAEKN